MFRFNSRIEEHSNSHWIGVFFDTPRERAKGSGFGGSLFVFLGLYFAHRHCLTDNLAKFSKP